MRFRLYHLLALCAFSAPLAHADLTYTFDIPQSAFTVENRSYGISNESIYGTVTLPDSFTTSGYYYNDGSADFNITMGDLILTPANFPYAEFEFLGTGGVITSAYIQGDSGPDDAELYIEPGYIYGYDYARGSQFEQESYGTATFTLAPAVAPTPEPSSIVLTLSGVLSAAGAAFRRRRNVSAV